MTDNNCDKPISSDVIDSTVDIPTMEDKNNTKQHLSNESSKFDRNIQSPSISSRSNANKRKRSSSDILADIRHYQKIYKKEKLKIERKKVKAMKETINLLIAMNSSLQDSCNVQLASNQFLKKKINNLRQLNMNCDLNGEINKSKMELD
ncbi:uncharacterized protein LOC123682408 [Harmonia axyridis]|uniref:uncharacterized protein LOC123682408 n=1 Tax=Harmonia axyridis TaxID=115357 RepID=UPI001E279D09|nr:uncharacterized protein LOC123682408 [Harmonia axyridis]